MVSLTKHLRVQGHRIQQKYIANWRVQHRFSGIQDDGCKMWKIFQVGCRILSESKNLKLQDGTTSNLLK